MEVGYTIHCILWMIKRKPREMKELEFLQPQTCYVASHLKPILAPRASWIGAKLLGLVYKACRALPHQHFWTLLPATTLSPQPPSPATCTLKSGGITLKHPDAQSLSQTKGFWLNWSPLGPRLWYFLQTSLCEFIILPKLRTIELSGLWAPLWKWDSFPWWWWGGEVINEDKLNYNFKRHLEFQ